MMKQFVFLIGFLFYTYSLYAECRENGLSAFPEERLIKQNSIFMLEGYAQSQKIISGLNTTHQIYLQSGNKKINLLVRKIYKGQFYLTQAILFPEIPLESGIEYTMHIDSLPAYERLNRYNSETKHSETITYKVLSYADTIKPILISQPKEQLKRLVHYGCGPSIYVDFDFPVRDSSEVLIKTTVKNIQTGKETTYCIIPYSSKISVGHSMCSGAFTFDQGVNYEVEFSFMDASGNTTAWTGKRIAFTKPVTSTPFDE